LSACSAIRAEDVFNIDSIRRMQHLTLQVGQVTRSESTSVRRQPRRWPDRAGRGPEPTAPISSTRDALMPLLALDPIFLSRMCLE